MPVFDHLEQVQWAEMSSAEQIDAAVRKLHDLVKVRNEATFGETGHLIRDHDHHYEASYVDGVEFDGPSESLAIPIEVFCLDPEEGVNHCAWCTPEATGNEYITHVSFIEIMGES